MPHSAGQVAYANAYQAATVAEMQSLVQPGNGVFSTSCLAHCLTEDSAYLTTFQANGVTVAAALGAWLQGSSPADISQCVGYPCAQQCPGGDQIEDMDEAIAASTPAAQAEEQERAGEGLGSEEAAEWAPVSEDGGLPAGGGAASGGAGGKSSGTPGEWQPTGAGSGSGGGAGSWPYGAQQASQAGSAGGNNWMLQGRRRLRTGR